MVALFTQMSRPEPPVEDLVAQAARLCFSTRNVSRRAAYSTYFNRLIVLAPTHQLPSTVRAYRLEWLSRLNQPFGHEAARLPTDIPFDRIY